jgi:hypothetical protein
MCNSEVFKGYYHLPGQKSAVDEKLWRRKEEQSSNVAKLNRKIQQIIRFFLYVAIFLLLCQVFSFSVRFNVGKCSIGKKKSADGLWKPAGTFSTFNPLCFALFSSNFVEKLAKIKI